LAQDADIRTVAQLLGHKDLRMAARYQQLALPSWQMQLVGRTASLAIYVTKTLPNQNR
jgi:site-specific recombinase XerD